MDAVNSPSSVVPIPPGTNNFSPNDNQARASVFTPQLLHQFD